MIEFEDAWIREMNCGPLRLLSKCVRTLRKRLGDEMDSKKHEVGAVYQSFYPISPSTKIRDHDVDDVLVVLLEDYPRKTRRELELMFHGYQLFLCKNKLEGKNTWILRWDPHYPLPQMGKMELLVDFPQ